MTIFRLLISGMFGTATATMFLSVTNWPWAVCLLFGAAIFALAYEFLDQIGGKR